MGSAIPAASSRSRAKTGAQSARSAKSPTRRKAPAGWERTLHCIRRHMGPGVRSSGSNRILLIPADESRSRAKVGAQSAHSAKSPTRRKAPLEWEQTL